MKTSPLINSTVWAKEGWRDGVGFQLPSYLIKGNHSIGMIGACPKYNIVLQFWRKFLFLHSATPFLKNYTEGTVIMTAVLTLWIPLDVFTSRGRLDTECQSHNLHPQKKIIFFIYLSKIIENVKFGCFVAECWGMMANDHHTNS